MAKCRVAVWIPSVVVAAGETLDQGLLPLSLVEEAIGMALGEAFASDPPVLCTGHPALTAIPVVEATGMIFGTTLDQEFLAIFPVVEVIGIILVEMVVRAVDSRANVNGEIHTWVTVDLVWIAPTGFRLGVPPPGVSLGAHTGDHTYHTEVHTKMQENFQTKISGEPHTETSAEFHAETSG